MKTARTMLLGAALVAGAPALDAAAQAFNPNKVEVAWNRYYDYNETLDIQRRIGAAYPGLVETVRIGESLQGRPMHLSIVTNPQTGAHDTKPAMYIEGNVHGNEIQATEVVLYTLWYLTKEYGQTQAITDLLDNYSFYLLPSVNPDGRQHWFDTANTSSTSRSNQRPVDNNFTGEADSDHYDDLDGDGSITQMWKEDPNGQWLRSQTDPRVFTRVRPGEKGNWTFLGFEGIDRDGDGRVNNDPIGGDDMNRNWPTDWQPTYVQGGAGLYPFSNPETRAIGDFILAHPNIAAGQSYHNTGGMMLRGPGAAYMASVYPADDIRVYDEIGRIGEDILPYYRYLVIHKDLYTVHGGFVNWLAEGLGIFSFTNELWTAGKYFQRDASRPTPEQMWLFRDKLQFGQVYTELTEFDHPQFGKILVGGLNKWASRVTPTFMLEEECHRNFAFTMLHAQSMPRLRFDRVDVAPLGEELWSVTVEVRNDALIPTRSGIARANRIGTSDILHCEAGGGVRVVAAGRVENWFTPWMDAVRHEPHRVQVAEGIGGRDGSIFRFVVSGPEGGEVTLRYEAQKAKDIERRVALRPTPARE